MRQARRLWRYRCSLRPARGPLGMPKPKRMNKLPPEPNAAAELGQVGKLASDDDCAKLLAVPRTLYVDGVPLSSEYRLPHPLDENAPSKAA